MSKLFGFSESLAKKVYNFFLNLLTPFKRLFTPLPKVQCPNFLDFLDPGGKIGKEMVSDMKTFAYKGCEIAAHKKKFFLANLAFLVGFFGIGATIRIG